MDALISGRSGRALLVDGPSLRSFDADDPSDLVPRRVSDFAYLFGEMTDLRLVQNTDIESVQEELKYDCDSALALELTLISLDGELPYDVRQEAMDGLNELLLDPRVAEHLENVLYARPLPSDADLITALRISRSNQLLLISALLQRFRERESLINEVSAAWDIVPTKAFGDYDRKVVFLRTAVNAGLFRLLVLTRETRATVGSFFVNASLNGSIQSLPNHRTVLQQWSAPFREATNILEIRHEADGFEVDSLPRNVRQRKRKGIDRAAILRNVESQKVLIMKAMEAKDFVRLRSLVQELVAYQLRNGEPIFAAMSLCDLAAEAKARSMFALQVELTGQSTRLKPDDAWSWTQHADSLLNVGRQVDALRAYEQADAFGGGAVAKRGRAETLKALGRLGEALAAYDAIILDYPESVISRNGRAETLKALGRLNEALEAYDEIIADHPQDLFPRNGRAETLKALGRLSEALDAYEAILVDHPENVVSKRGRADTLKALGRLSEALGAYDVIIAECQESVYSRTGRAETLKALGRLHDALEAYDALIADYPESLVCRRGRAETLKSLGRLTEALHAYDAIIAEYPENVISRNGRAETLKALGRLSEALDAYDDIVTDHPESIISKNGRADTLKTLGRLNEALDAYDAIINTYAQDVVSKCGHAETLKALGRLNEALDAYCAIINTYPQDVVARCGHADTLKSLGRLNEALAAYETIIADYPQDVVSKSGRAETLKALGKFKEALEAYDAIVSDYPDNIFSGYGRSCVLAELQRYDEAIAGLPSAPPITPVDWIGFHIRGMIMLRQSKIAEAIRIFQLGVERNPIPLGKQYFHTALSVALMRRGEYQRARDLLLNVEAQELQHQASVLLTHCFGAENQTTQAIGAFRRLSTKPWSVSDELIEELHRRYIMKQPPRRSDDWIFDQEVGSILVVATQQAPISNYSS